MYDPNHSRLDSAGLWFGVLGVSFISFTLSKYYPPTISCLIGQFGHWIPGFQNWIEPGHDLEFLSPYYYLLLTLVYRIDVCMRIYFWQSFLLTSIEDKRHLFSEINVHARLFGTLEYLIHSPLTISSLIGHGMPGFRDSRLDRARPWFRVSFQDGFNHEMDPGKKIFLVPSRHRCSTQ